MANLGDAFDKSWQAESKKHAAHAIWTGVKDWRGDKRSIGQRRTIWEIFQNAVDAATGNRIEHLSLSVDTSGQDLVISHNGGPFRLEEIIALVSGGTSKYPNQPLAKIGKFAKGFICTHAVSLRVGVEGWVSYESNLNKFRIELDRSGDEALIEKNINNCRNELDNKNETEIKLKQNECVFRYHDPSEGSLPQIVSELEQNVPYAFAFNPLMQSVSVTLSNGPLGWERKPISNEAQRGTVRPSGLIKTPKGEIGYFLKALNGLELCVLYKQVDGRRILVDTRGNPALYLNFPLHNSNKLGLSYALNSSSFDVDTDRSFLEYEKINSDILTNFKSLLEKTTDDLINLQASRLDLLAHVDLSNLLETPVKQILRQNLAVVPRVFLERKIVELERNTQEPAHTWFPLGKFGEQTLPELTNKMHEIVSLFDKNPVKEYIEWEKIVEEWKHLGVTLSTYSLEDTLNKADSFFNLVLDSEKRTFVSKLIGALIFIRSVTKHLPENISKQRFLLNQNGSLISPQSAIVDSGIKNSLKDLAISLDFDIRSHLLDTDLLAEESVDTFIKNIVDIEDQIYSNKVLLNKLWDLHVSKEWKSKQNDTNYKKGLVNLLVWLLMEDDTDAIMEFRDELPLLTSDGKFRTLSETKSPLLHPESVWEDDLQAYKHVISSNKVLSNEYLTGLAQNSKLFLEALDKLEIAFPSPCFIAKSPREFDLDEVRQITSEGSPTGKLKLSKYSDIISFEDMTSASARDEERAIQNLKFILGYCLSHDSSWKYPEQIEGGLKIYKSFWIAKLKTKYWVPSLDAKRSDPLNLENLERLLPKITDLQLSPEMQSFLETHFDFNASMLLAAKIRSTNPLDNRVRVAEKLFSLPQEMAHRVAEQIEIKINNMQQVGRNKSLGNVIEEIAKGSFPDFKTEWTGIGSDFSIELDPEMIGTLKVIGTQGIIFVEVKAASSNSVRMTLPQCREAVSKQMNFLLCVADLRYLSLNLMEESETSQEQKEQIRSYLRFVKNIGSKVAQSLEKAEELESHETDLSNEEITPGVQIKFEKTSIRIAVMDEIWSEGLSLDEAIGYCNSVLRGNSTW